jgi:hypothetical protein
VPLAINESVTLRELASRLAAIKGCGFVGEYDPALRYSDPLYFWPNDTLVGIDAASALGHKRGGGFCSAGVVPFAFTATEGRSPIHCPMPTRTHRRDGLRNLRIAFATWCFGLLGVCEARCSRRRDATGFELGRVRLKASGGDRWPWPVDRRR